MINQTAGLVLAVILILALGGALLQAVLPPYQSTNPGVYMPGPDTGPFANW